MAQSDSLLFVIACMLLRSRFVLSNRLTRKLSLFVVRKRPMLVRLPGQICVSSGMVRSRLRILRRLRTMFVVCVTVGRRTIRPADLFAVTSLISLPMKVCLLRTVSIGC